MQVSIGALLIYDFVPRSAFLMIVYQKLVRGKDTVIWRRGTGEGVRNAAISISRRV